MDIKTFFLAAAFLSLPIGLVFIGDEDPSSYERQMFELCDRLPAEKQKSINCRQYW